jgi:hypothetical protein
VVAALLTACGDSTAPRNAPAELVIGAVDTLRSIGATASLTATVRNARHEPIPGSTISSWGSSAPTIVQVDPASGLVTALSNGTATITARSGTVAGTMTIVVRQRAKVLQVVSPPDTLRALGATVQYTVAARDSGGTAIADPIARWMSTDTSRVTVDSVRGLATAIANGSAWVHVVAGDALDSAQLVVHQRIDPARSTLVIARPLLLVGDTVPVTLQARDSLGHPLTFGGATVTFSATGGTSTSTPGVPVDRGDGSYVSPFIGTGMGTESLVGATINGTQVSTAAPSLHVVGFTKVGAYGLNGGYTCGILTTRQMYCWGATGGGVRGTGVENESGPGPTLVGGDHQWSDFDVGAAGPCGIDVNAKLYCWGDAGAGSLGNGATGGHYPSLTPVLPESSFAAVDLGIGNGACAITSGHGAMCWSTGTWGRLGNGADTLVAVPVAVNGGNRFSAIATSFSGTCGVTETGSAMCWGYYGSVGAGGIAPDDCEGIGCAKSPVATSGGIIFKPVITRDGNLVCAITPTERTYCWGYFSSVPTEVSGAPPFTALATGDTDACGISDIGTVYCWGTNRNGRFGAPADINLVQQTPVPIPGNHVFTGISMGQNHMCGVTTDGNAWCWGSNSTGELGDRTTTSSTSPVRVKLFAP